MGSSETGVDEMDWTNSADEKVVKYYYQNECLFVRISIHQQEIGHRSRDKRPDNDDDCHRHEEPHHRVDG